MSYATTGTSAVMIRETMDDIDQANAYVRLNDLHSMAGWRGAERESARGETLFIGQIGRGEGYQWYNVPRV